METQSTRRLPTNTEICVAHAHLSFAELEARIALFERALCAGETNHLGYEGHPITVADAKRALRHTVYALSAARGLK